MQQILDENRTITITPIEDSTEEYGKKANGQKQNSNNNLAKVFPSVEGQNSYILEKNEEQIDDLKKEIEKLSPKETPREIK